MSETKKESRLGEIIRFVFTGGFCFVIEFIALVLLRDTMGLSTMVATPVAFLISVIVNYLLCMMWVFKGTKDAGFAAKVGFVVTSLIGLLLNQLFMWLFCTLFGENAVILTLFGFTATMYMLNKVLATILVMVWNYFTKRAVLSSGLMTTLIDRLKGNKA
ncbi:MAG: GtrA family protein [Clostridia bacterium]|nr:GtrA family protein [Clostridia bacterium]